LLYFLRDKRVLDNLNPQEEVGYVINSVLKMREEVVKTHNSLDEDSDAARPVDEMRAACVQFLRQMQSLPNVPEGQTMFYWKPEQIEVYAQALSELRTIVNSRRDELKQRYGVKEGDRPPD
jgi:hypothetical protein